MLPLPVLHGAHEFSLSAWHLEPSVLGAAMIVIGLYVYAANRPDSGIDGRRVLLFTLGTASMLFALISPLDAGADRLLSLHMLQHVFLTTIGPPLVILGLPPGTLRRLFNGRAMGGVLRALTMPVVTGALFILNMWLWHIPPVYELALKHLDVHIAMHIAFMGTGLLFWWPVVRVVPELSRIGDGGRLLYLFVTGFPMGLLALLFIASPNTVYGYYDGADRLFGMTPVVDQQVAGIIMGALGEAASFIAMTLLFFRFLDRDEVAADAALGRGTIDAA